MTTDGGTSATGSADRYTFNAAPQRPSVSAVAANSGSAAGGTVVTVSGSNFTGASAVQFGGIDAYSFSVLADNVLIATAPAQAAGTVDVNVTTPTGTSSTGAADHYHATTQCRGASSIQFAGHELVVRPPAARRSPSPAAT